jgi:hypothetical protein
MHFMNGFPLQMMCCNCFFCYCFCLKSDPLLWKQDPTHPQMQGIKQLGQMRKLYWVEANLINRAKSMRAQNNEDPQELSWPVAPH